MATNTGSNGGKNNPGNGVMRGPANIDQSSGINSALNQGTFRREYNDKMFSESGWLQSSIKDLEAQSKELDKLLKSSEKLTKVEKDRYENMLSNMDQLIREQNEMYTKQEASSKELQSSLDKSSKARLKTVDELYKHYHKKEKELNDVGKRQIEAKLRQLASQSREIKAQSEDMNAATDAFDKAQKTLSKGVGEFVDNLQSGLSDFIKVLSLNNLASNEFLDKANERYEIMNKINSQLGYSAAESTRTYNSLVKNFNEFNSNVGNLFSLDDLNQYIKDSNGIGIHNEKLLRDNLEQSIIATKYLGMSNDTQTSLYKYMKLTNNNDSIASYNKMMIALQKQHIGVSSEMLDEMIKSGENVNDVLTASGADLTKWNSQREAVAGVLSSKGYTDDQVKNIQSALDNAVLNLTTQSGLTQLAQMGINPMSFKNTVQSGNYLSALEMFMNGNNRMAGAFGGDIMTSGLLREALGLDLGVANDTNALSKDFNDIKEAVHNVLKEQENISDQDVKSYTEQNKQQTWVKKGYNWLKGKIEDIFGSGWFNFESLGTAAFALYLGATGWKVISKLASPLFNFLGGKGIAGAALGKLGSGLATVGLTAATIAAIGLALKNRDVEAQSENEALASSRTGNSNSLSNKITGAGYTKDAIDWENDSWLGAGFSYLGHGIGMLFTNNSVKDKYNNLQTILNHSDYSKDSKFRELATLAWMIAADNANVLSAIGESKENLINHLKTMNPSDFETMVQGLSGEGKYKNLYQLINGFTAPVGSDGTVYNGKNMSVDQYYQYVGTGLDGYHKAGLAYVPKENYKALLHQGEMVLNKEDAEAYRNAFGYGGSLNPNDKDYVGPHHGGYAGHQGIDLYFSKVGTPVGSAIAGTVISSYDIPWTGKPVAAGKKGSDGKYHGKDTNGNSYSSYGRVVKVKGTDGNTYIYGHLNKRAVSTGDVVSAGTLLGYSGTTGNSSGPHLHFEVAGKGTGEANHAKYYTNYVRSANGAAAQTGVTGSIKTGENTIARNSSMSGERSGLAKVNTTGHRAIPGIGGAGNTSGNTTDRIVNSIDGVSIKIIKYLDEIRKEQEDQRQLINAFSASQQSIIDYR